MKLRLVALIFVIAVFSIPFCGCSRILDSLKKTGINDPDGLLPDWEMISSGKNWARYSSVTPEMAASYIDDCKEKGFTAIGPDSDGSSILIRNDTWIKMTETFEPNMEDGDSLISCIEIELFYSSGSSDGVSATRAKALIGRYLDTGCAVAAVLKRSPTGLLEEFGLSYYLCVVKEGKGAEHYMMSCLVGENGILEVVSPIGAIAADIDGDYENELIIHSFGPTSGVYTEEIDVIGVSNGVPYIEASRIFVMDYGRTGLKLTGDGAAFSLARNVYDIKTGKSHYEEAKLYPIRLDGINLTIELPEGDENGPRVWGAGHPYAHYDMDPSVDLEKGLAVIARRSSGGYSFALLPMDETELTPYQYNALTPKSADEISFLLDSYGLPRDKISVIIAELPAKDASSIRAATDAERAEILNLIGR